VVDFDGVGSVLGACLVGMDYTRYSALQSSTVWYAVTYLGDGWVLWLVCFRLHLHTEHEPVDTLISIASFFAGIHRQSETHTTSGR